MTLKKTENSVLLKMLHMSLISKRKAGWSREVGAGFVAEDLDHVHVNWQSKTTIHIHLKFGDCIEIALKDLNLREVEELIKFVVVQRLKEIETHYKNEWLTKYQIS